MDESSPREILASLIAESGDNYGSLSRLIGRNAAYIQQFIKRGTPRKLDEADRRALASYFGVDESLLGAPEADSAAEKRSSKSNKNNMIYLVKKFDLAASAGAGALAAEERATGVIGFDHRWLRRLGLSAENLSIIDVKGESMAPTLNNGDTIMVDRGDGVDRLRDGIYVLRLDDALMVKRVSLSPRHAKELTITSDNTHYPRWENVDQSLVDIVGRVVWASRMLI